MATEELLERLRRMTGETDSDTYTDTQLDGFLDDVSGDINLAASRIWGEKASGYADLVNMSEAGSSRSNSDLFTHAKAQQEYFSGISGGDESITVVSSTTRPIVRR